MCIFVCVCEWVCVCVYVSVRVCVNTCVYVSLYYTYLCHAQTCFHSINGIENE